MLDVSYAKEERMVHKVINAFDLPSYKIASHFEDTFHFISTALARGNVLVHCVAGISRSPTLVIAFLMRRDGMGFQDAFDLVKNKRSIVCPNEGFQRELKAYESTIKKPLPVIDKAKQRLETVNGSECNLPDGMKRKEVSSCVGKRSYSLGPVKSLTGKLLLSVGNCTNRERRSSLESVKSQQLRLQPAGVPPRKREEERQQSK